MRGERTLVVFLIFLMIILGCEGKKISAVPDFLIGVWGTSDPMYADRTFEITRGEIIFQTGEKTFDTYTIKGIKVEKVPGEKTPLYVFTYKNIEGLKYKFSFYYFPGDNESIRFKNQYQIVWTKEGK